MALNQQK